MTLAEMREKYPKAFERALVLDISCIVAKMCPSDADLNNCDDQKCYPDEIEACKECWKQALQEAEEES